jgi:hypothetical protein
MKEMNTMLRLEHSDTNMVSTQDWLRASKDMTISAYEPRTTTHNPAAVSTAALAAHDTPFFATHPSVAGKRNSVRAADDEEAITLGRAREAHPRQHANARTVFHAKKQR